MNDKAKKRALSLEGKLLRGEAEQVSLVLEKTRIENNNRKHGGGNQWWRRHDTHIIATKHVIYLVWDN